ncbi:isocitrate lyase/phosphoenolpyruvate mutase family protein [Paracoccus suum]|uniref:Isocitrate lyase/phosphoenolpyruvate mutase family protein n=1 Tax=Paracoccus suum TaxID=2259340 RepID=A0A344PNI4_9RHOB|nr:isocitrate lyase/phosphoenolpyruvate mutase family protein [Paracoccus suum]AXC50939.1 isocitrate lyase/phosphoenolpyruvate mutase family protein [Paracoccus suum]
MEDQIAKARAFRALHVPGKPVVLYNIWDAGSARAVQRAGAKAIATGSWSVAAANGYDDGQAMPMSEVLAAARRIVQSVDLPVSIDFEGGYAAAPDAVADNVRLLLEVGAIGLNFEDQVVGGEGLHPIAEQAERVAAVRSAAEALGVPTFINARTDLFLKASAEEHPALLDEAVQRAAVYAAAGADGFFAPGLREPGLVTELCKRVALPVNIMLSDPADVGAVARLGVGRISFGPAPYRTAMAGIEAAAQGLA